MSWWKIFQTKVAEGNDSTHFTSTTGESINWMHLPSIFFYLTCQMIFGCIAVDFMITATGHLVTLVPSPLAEYCTLFRVRGCRMRGTKRLRKRSKAVGVNESRPCLPWCVLFCSVVFFSVLVCFILYCSVLVYSLLFSFILFSCIVFCSILFLFRSIILYLIQFHSILF